MLQAGHGVTRGGIGRNKPSQERDKVPGFCCGHAVSQGAAFRSATNLPLRDTMLL